MPSAPLPPCRAPGCPVLGPCAAHDQTRDQLQPWRAWYRIARWRHPVWGLRSQVLRDQPLCVDCRAAGRVTAAVDVDHITPHHGDPLLFWSRHNLQGLCKVHHTEKTQREQGHGE